MRLNHSASSNIPRCFVVRAKKIEPREESLQNLRDRLIEQLENNSYECMICCQIVEANQWIWTCQKCFHMFHISRGRTNGCITQWALKCRSESADEGWRCPSCQHVSYELPTEYKCFCGKEANPRMKRFPDLPHSCGGICGKSRGFGCPHTCTERCHPGPCPDCPLFTTIMCNCGRETKKIRCGSQAEFECSSACGKKLNCGLHTCARICHKGDCESCSQMISQSQRVV
ncbi:hypothetical protein AB6A40_011346 [Gnathostoma spinigerum]|uniref:NF-X1-type domain-containing protein n=1 Tax=Gnathostoma spinigerum TaxID=75299 RepID=A0ABD6F473_9BILA